MRRLLVVVALAVVGFLALPSGAASAHPLGNFSVNRYAALTLHPDRVDAVFAADLAELPTLQEAPPTCAEAGLSVTVSGSVLQWTITRSSLIYVDGAGGLKTSRLECGLTAPAALDRPATVTVENRFRDDRIGWRELVATGVGVRLVDPPVPAAGISDELRAYPDDLLASPPDVRSATLTVSPGTASAVAPVAVGSTSGRSGFLASAEQRLTDLVGGRLTPLVGTLAVLLALVLGAAHAALPGHGKTVMAAYLAGRRGRARDAVAVGATVTLTHTGGVLALGLLLTAAAGVAGEAVLGWLGLASGVLVVAVGAGALRSALRSRSARTTAAHAHAGPGQDTHGHAGHDGHGHAGPDGHGPAGQAADQPAGRGMPGGHGHAGHGHAEHAGHDWHGPAGHGELGPGHGEPGHSHGHGHHGHSHGSGHHHHGAGVSRWSIAGLGVAGGLVPSPSALVVLLGAIALGRTAFGIVLVLAYGLGMAATLTAAGLLLIRLRDRYAGRFADRLTRRWRRLAPSATGALVVLVGLGLAGRALAGLA